MIEKPDEERRHSRAVIPPLIADDTLRAEAEVRNGLLQYDEGIAAALHALDVIRDGNTWRLRPSLIQKLQRRALLDISIFAGNFRPGPVHITKSKHTPPDAHLVPELVEDFCDYINDNWGSKTPVHLAAYSLWRLNWIHPFDDGNGRTARIISYVVMMVRVGHYLGGNPTIPELITKHRADYFAALDAADAHFKVGELDISAMEALLSSLLAKQLASIYEKASGTVSKDAV